MPLAPPIFFLIVSFLCATKTKYKEFISLIKVASHTLKKLAYSCVGYITRRLQRVADRGPARSGSGPNHAQPCLGKCLLRMHSFSLSTKFARRTDQIDDLIVIQSGLMPEKK